ncbi:MAG: ATP-binding protein [Bacteroidota bacterium]
MEELLTYIVLGSFLLATLALGLWAFVNDRVKTMKEYVLANKELSTAVVTMSLLATFIGSGSLAKPFYTYQHGIGNLIFPIFYVTGLCLVGVFIAPYMIYFQDCLTLGDVMNKLYGNIVRIVTGFISVAFCLLVVISQLRVIGHIGVNVLGLSDVQVIVGIGLIIVLYTSLSGMRGVAYTDVWQFIVMTGTFLVIAGVLLTKVNGLKMLFAQIPSEKLKNVFSSQRTLKAFFWYLLPTYFLAPPILMRMLMIEDKRKVKNMFFATAGIYAVVNLILTVIGFSAVVYFSNNASFSEVTLPHEASGFIGYIIKDLFHSNKVVYLLMAIGLLFLLASTIDSYLHATGIALVHDVIKPLCDRRNIVINEIRCSKWATFCIGILSIVICFTELDLVGRFSGDTIFLFNLILVPLILGIIGFKTDVTSLLIFSITLSFGVAVSFFLIRSGIYFQQIDLPFLISVGIASFLFFTSHYIQNQGFVMVHRAQDATGYSVHKPSWRGLVSALASWVTPTKLARVAQRKVYTYGSEPFLFSLFFVCIPPFILLNILESLTALYIVFMAYSIGVVLVVGLMIEVKWVSWLKSYFDLYWFATLGYCLAGFGGLMFLVNPQSAGAMIGFCLFLLVLMLCVDWQTFVILSSLGISAAIVVYRVLSGHFWPSMDFNMGWDLAMTLSTVLIAGFSFAHRKELYNVTQLKKAKLYAGSIAHETNNYLGVSMFAGDVIKRALQTKKIKPLQEVEEGGQRKENLYVIPEELYEQLMFVGPQLAEGARQSASKIEMFMSALREDILNAKREVVSMKACIEEALKDVYFQDEEVKKRLLLEIDDDFKTTVSRSYFKHIVYNIVKNAYYHGGASQVKIILDKSKRTLTVRDNGKGISTEKLPYIFDLFYSGGHSSGIGLALVKLIVESFGGRVHVESRQGKGSFTAFSITFAEEV